MCIGISELVLYPFKLHSAIQTLGMLKHSQSCDPARQELAADVRGWNNRSAVLCSKSQDLILRILHTSQFQAKTNLAMFTLC